MRSSPRGRGWAKGEANRCLDGRCTPVMRRVTREWAGMRVWPATRATPLTEVRSRRISRTAGCKTGGTISKLFNKLLNLPNTFIPTSAGTSLFFFLVEGSLETLTTNTGTPSHFCPKSSTIIRNLQPVCCLQGHLSHGKEVRVLQVFRHPPLSHSGNLTPCINQSPHFPTVHHNVYCGASSNHAHRIHVPRCLGPDGWG